MTKSEKRAQAYADLVAELDATTGAFPCVHGHIGCADRKGGLCTDEELSAAADQAATQMQDIDD